jgi:hypothetical protein
LSMQVAHHSQSTEKTQVISSINAACSANADHQRGDATSTVSNRMDTRGSRGKELGG